MLKAIIGGILAAAAIMALAIVFLSGAFSAPGGPSATAEAEPQQVITLPWPALSEEEQARAVDIVLADPRLQQVLQGKSWTVEDIWPRPSSPEERFEAPFSQAWMNIAFDRVYTIEAEWIWPPEGIFSYGRDEQHRTSNVRSMAIAVSLRDGRVVGFVDVPQFVPQDRIINPNEPKGPTLTEEQKAWALQIALASPYVQRFLDGRSYTVGYGTPISLDALDPETNTYKLMTISVGFKLDKYYYIDDVDWLWSSTSGASRWGQTLQTAVARISYPAGELRAFLPQPPIPDSERGSHMQEWLRKQREGTGRDPLGLDGASQ